MAFPPNAAKLAAYRSTAVHSGVDAADPHRLIVMMMDGFGVEGPQELVLVTKQLLYFERYARELAPDWALARDLYLVKNIFPEAVKEKAAHEGLVLPD